MANSRRSIVVLIGASVLVLSLIGVYFQGGKLGVEYLRTEQLRRHLEILEGHAGSPTQYRLLSEWLVEAWVQALARLGVSEAIVVGFLSFRVVQNMIILSLAATFYRRLGLRNPAVLASLAVVTWSMTHSLYDSDLSFNLYGDLIFYLAAGVLTYSRRDPWIVLLMGLAAANRETSGLILALFLLARYRSGLKWDRRTIVIALAALVAFLAGYLAVRWALGPRPVTLPHGRTPGLDLLDYNLFRRQTWVHLAACWSVFPVIALLGVRRLPQTLRRWLIAVPPVWLAVHFTLAVAAEVRLMLMPQLMIFVPAAFLTIQNASGPVHQGTDGDGNGAAAQTEGRQKQGDIGGR